MPFSQANRRFLIAVTALLVVVAALSSVAVILIFSQSSAVDALKTFAARGECRGQVKNDADDRFQHRLADLLDAAEHRDTVRVARITRQIQDELPVQQQIDKNCPSALVRVTTRTTALSP